MRSLLLALLASLAVPAVAFAADYVVDPLTSDTNAGRGGSRGGTFSANGWTTSAGTDTVWYEISDALPTGSVEFTVSGLQVGATLDGADHDLVAVYQAPDGVGEPIGYAPWYRNNDMKVFLRLFGSAETTRPGALKLEFAVCVMGPPWYDNACGAGCPQLEGFAYANGCWSGSNCIDWDPAKAYRMVLFWGNGKMGMTRDGVELGSVDYASSVGTYAPQPLRIRIGSPRNDNSGLQSMPKGITFRDVKISGTPGSRTPVCGAQPPGPDAGVVVEPPDAGAPGSCDEHGVVADVTAASWEAGVFPDVNDLNVEGGAGGAPGAVAYLRFPALGGTATQALLKLHTANTSSAAGGSGQVCLVTDESWSEAGLTWANKPAWGSCVGTEHAVSQDQEVEWDVTSLLGGLAPTSTVNLVVVSHDGNGAHYLSRESGGGAQGPRLCTKVAPWVPPDAGAPAVPPDAAQVLPGADAEPVVPGSDAAQIVPGSDAAQVVPGADGSTTQPGGDASANTAADAGKDIGVQGSCGCGAGGQGLALAAALAALVAATRRRR